MKIPSAIGCTFYNMVKKRRLVDLCYVLVYKKSWRIFVKKVKNFF